MLPPPGSCGRGACQRLCCACAREYFALILSEHILDEIERTLESPYFARRLSVEQRARDVAILRANAVVTPITVDVHGVATHPEDDLVLATAVSGGAAYLVTGDKKLQQLRLYAGVTIVSPRQVIDEVLPQFENTELS